MTCVNRTSYLWIALCVFLAASVVLASRIGIGTDGDTRYSSVYKSKPNVIDSGGGTSTSSTCFTVASTGQLAIGPASSAMFTNEAGFFTPEQTETEVTGIAVINTNDSGEGSLRQAILDANANAGPDTIVFNIPETDPGYDPGTGVWTIRPLVEFHTIRDNGTVIDGSSQAAFIGSDTNPYGPEIEIEGTNAGNANGFTIESANTVIKDLVINRFSGDFWANGRGIRIARIGATGNVVVGCYIGTDATGMVALGNAYGGITIEDGASGNRIGGPNPLERNVISGTTAAVNVVSGCGVTIGEHVGYDPEIRCSDNIVQGNYIGTNRDGTAPLSNFRDGIVIYQGKNNSIGGTASGEGNLISGNNRFGMFIRAEHTTGNTVAGNRIGTDAAGMTDLGNGSNGIQIDYGAFNNTIGPQNSIAYNGGDGILVKHDTTTGNVITQNSITANAGMGISTHEGGNTELAPPTIVTVSEDMVSGMACPGCIVEIFSDSEDEGALYEGTAIADGSGDFTLSVNVTGPYVTATVTDPDGNTSAFSEPIGIGVCLVGDVNCDGNITPGDALCAFWRSILGSFQEECECQCSQQTAEINCDGSITPGDALCIFWRAILGNWPEDCLCPTAKMAVREPAVDRIGIESVNGIPGGRVVVPIAVDRPRDLNAFSFELAFPDDMLEFRGVSATDATLEWIVLEGTETCAGVITIGGFHTDGMYSDGSVPIVDVTFDVRRDGIGKGEFHLVNLMDDVAGVRVETGHVIVSKHPTKHTLLQNYPNPFNPETDIRYEITDSKSHNHLSLKVYNILGQEVRTLVDGNQVPGYYTITWNGRDNQNQEVPGGVYFYRIETGGYCVVKRMVLLK